jgi:transposase
MTFKQYSQNQNLLLPPSFADFLGESHEAVVLAEFLKELDTHALEQSYANETGGSSAYHPVMLLSLLVYAYMNGVFSSRVLAKKLRQDLAFMFLSGNSTPDFRTLARFRKDKGVFLEPIFVQVVHKAKELGLVSFGTTSLDGTKLYANASKDKNETISGLKEKIKDLLIQANSVDASEDGLYGDSEDAVDPQLKTKAGRDKKRQELKTRKETASAKLNTTDPDSKLMQMKRKDYAQGFNVQAVTENGFVLSSAIFNTSADQGTLSPTLEHLKAQYGFLPQRLLADKGYSSEDNYTFCEQSNINAYIPIYKPGTNLTGFTYHPKSDTYTDKQGRIYSFKQRMGKRDESPVKQGRPTISLTIASQKRFHRRYKRIIYLYQNTKTKAKKFLCISPLWQKYMKEQKQKLSTLKGKLLYRKRMTDVEGVFANIKHNLNFTRFRLRGFQGVSTEWNLISMAHNLKKLL